MLEKHKCFLETHVLCLLSGLVNGWFVCHAGLCKGSGPSAGPGLPLLLVTVAQPICRAAMEPRQAAAGWQEAERGVEEGTTRLILPLSQTLPFNKQCFYCQKDQDIFQL